MIVENAPVVTNAPNTIAHSVQIGSKLLAVDDIPAQAYLADRAMPLVCETTVHRRLDHAVSRLRLGSQGSRFLPTHFMTFAT